MKSALTYISLLALLIGLISCDPDSILNPCAECYEDKPLDGLITVQVTIDDLNDTIPITIYKGKLEGELVYHRDTLTESKADFWVPVGSFYTVEASYKSVGVTTLSVDGDRVTVYLDDSNCDVACWRPNDGKADCRLN